jgi:hypothetical protein
VQFWNFCRASPAVSLGRCLFVRAAWFAVAALIVVNVLGPTDARAQFVVTNTNTNDSGSGSLRQAILDSNAAGAPSGVPGTTQTITFAPGVGTITLQSALPPIYTNVNMVGTAGATIDGAGTYRGLFVSGLATTGSGAPPTINVSISNITIQNVVAQGGAGGSGGGGGGLGAGRALFVNQNARRCAPNATTKCKCEIDPASKPCHAPFTNGWLLTNVNCRVSLAMVLVHDRRNSRVAHCGEPDKTDRRTHHARL